MLQARLCLLLTAFIWGSTFIAQRMVADNISPFGYNGIRFLLGALTITPLLFFMKDSTPRETPKLPLSVACILIGFILFAGAALQQFALIFTTAGKAAFLTALYIVLVPLTGLFFGQRLSLYSLVGVILALIGAALLTLKDNAPIAPADLALLISTFFWVIHILLLSKFSKQYPVFKLSFGQFIVCGLFSLITAQLTEPLTMAQISDALIPILWGGILSVGIGFTGQIVGQKRVPPTEASLIMSLEMVFAVLTGYLFLGETMTFTEIKGVVALSIGVILAQLPCKYSLPPIRSSSN